MQSTRRLFFRCRLCLQRLPREKWFAQPLQRRCMSVEPSISAAPTTSSDQPIPPPSLDGNPREYPEKITTIVDSISSLTLLETSQLNELLKVTLKIPDAPVMAMGAMPTATPATTQESTEEEPEDTQSSFTVRLVKFEPDSKIKVIKEVKAQTEGMNLVQAKKFVESVPQEVKGGISKEDATKLAAALEAVGGTVEIV